MWVEPKPFCVAIGGLAFCIGDSSDVTVPTYSLGTFTIQLASNPLYLNIRDLSGHDVLTSVVGFPFISTSPGVDTFSDSSGNFFITESTSPRCAGQTITSTTESKFPPRLLFDGLLTGCSGNSSSVPYSFGLSLLDDLTDRVVITAAIYPLSEYSRVYLSYASPADEGFYGFGGMASWGDLRGQSVPIFTREGGIGRGSEPITSVLNSNPSLAGAFAGGSRYTSYTAIPQYISTRGSLFYLLGSQYASFDLAKANRQAVTVRYNGPTMLAHILRSKNSDMLEAVASYTAWTGRQPPLPAWVDDGAILGLQGGQQKVEDIVKTTRTLNLPLAAVWLQDWCGTRFQEGYYGINISRLWWNWEPDASLYPTWPSFVQNLRSQYDVRTLSYVNTFLADVSAKDTRYKRNFYAEAVAGGRLVMNTVTKQPLKITSGPGIDAGLLDLSNTTTVQWFKQLVKDQFWSANISGMMVDFGEYLPVTPNVSISSGKASPSVFHNIYPSAWSQLQREVVKELGLQQEAVAFHRSASTHSINATNLFWVGDQNVDWESFDGLRSVISSSVHLGFGGMGAAHSDIGGYTTVLGPTFNITRSAELLGRWGELGALSGAVFRTHEGVIPSVNAQVYSNASTWAYHAYNTRLFVSLKRYRRALLLDVTEKGWPLVRHPVVYYPNDPVVRLIIDEEYFFGASLLIASVYHPLATRVSAYLPGSGLWQHLWSGTLYKGGMTVSVAAPLGQPGVFVKYPRDDDGMLDDLFAFATNERLNLTVV